MAELLMLLCCKQLERKLEGSILTDRDVQLQLKKTTPAEEGKGATGQTILTPLSTSVSTADPTCLSGHKSPQIARSGPLSTSLFLKAQAMSSRMYRRMYSSNKRDPTTPCPLPSAQGSTLTTRSAIVMYAQLHLSPY